MKKDRAFLIRVPDELHKKIKLMCVNKGIPMNKFILQILNDIK